MKHLVSWDEVVKFHGHSCMGLAIGYRAAEAALKELNNNHDVDEELIGIVENDSCAIDAIQYVTGCTMGKGNLFFRDCGKQVYTFCRRSDGKAVRLVAKSFDDNKYPELKVLREKIISGEATEEEQQLCDQLMQEALETYLSDPLGDAVEIQEVKFDIPEKASIFSSVNCAECGERVMEPRARVKKGHPVCIPCADLYERKV